MKSVIKRILGTIPVLIGVVLLIFIMLRIVPGNAAAMLLFPNCQSVKTMLCAGEHNFPRRRCFGTALL